LSAAGYSGCGPRAGSGFPTGYANRSETFEDTLVREVREETGLAVQVGRLVRLKSGYRLRVEVAYEAVYVGGTLKLDSVEILGGCP
jgi:8-oxo-dGTP pyrophosphatase MutT (NUDIX family)